ncbi:type I restriction endonuclease subunit R [Bacteroides acidifaciens]|jgi:type I restriction enzyme R subunit|uniref:type I restriction endonuclease subunit R n=1 Tax=Bacteroides acidifaciens TaxID=85831 RepID=UPI00259B82D1|nr:type I restriction endonuclease subunit R [Bacteroides acidifaciens]
MIRERQIEDIFIQKLKDLKYSYRPDINNRATLEQNFREKFERLNRVHLTDSEFNRLLEDIADSDVFLSSKRLRERNTFIREDGTPLQYTLVNIKEWCKNDYEVVNQLRMNTRDSFQRYDVIILINGIPVVQIELKALEVSPRRAMQQIVDYKNDIGNGYTNSLLCFIQMFIVSNQNITYYFANNNNQHFNFNADEQFLPVYQWADENNKKITNLDDFSDTFLAKCKLGKMISRYMVLVANEQKMLIMRPYQIYAVNAIMSCIEENRGNGYIWHTTGSGKTLTSFKASTLLKENPDIEKCLFVVDRKDLDKQTREEFNKFQDGCVEENTNTDSLVRRMLSDDYSDKIIVTTIQKLGIALDPHSRNNYQERLLPLKNKRIVFIFDECHRSQFGENHKAIKEFFPKAQLFGFTGTPIFDENATYTQITGEEAQYKTTKDVFQHELHTYTITNAIEDKNVLRFHIDYYKPDDLYASIGEYMRKQAIAEAILKKHRAATSDYRFNALFATSSINDAIEYYKILQELQDKYKSQSDEYIPLNIACVFSPPAYGNRDIMQIQEDLEQERRDNEVEPDKKRMALEKIIKDYNEQYGTNHTVMEFDIYYQDIQQRIKDQKYTNKDYPRKNKIDIVIVVDMLLTGFDSKYLNTLYVDKNLKHHHLIQAFSRTNRILNDTKPYGNILDFRGQQSAVDAAIALFSGEKGEFARQIWLVEPASVIKTKYKEAISKLKDFMSDNNLEFKASEVANLKGDAAKAGFINCFKEVQRFWTQLSQYTDLVEYTTDESPVLSDPVSGYGFTDDDLKAFRGAYLDLANSLKKRRDKKSNDTSAEIDELDFEFVLFASAMIDYDYIMELIARYASTSYKVRITKEDLISLVSSNANLIEERDDIIAYIESLDGVNGKTEQEIKDGYQVFKTEKFAKELITIAETHSLGVSALQEFVHNIVERKIFDGEKLSELIAPLELGWKDRTNKEKAIMTDLIPLLKRMAGGQKISGLSAYDEE